ncbi:hypothetical protein [Streptomyces sp. NPDC020362]|uniref:hypothetical protein n=1 Tax=unclassified Streptomyces TaxID=2593676 RepID=UPI000B2FEC37
MPTFHRPPEWQQQADRHTELVDPVLTVRQLGRFDLGLKSLVRIDHALVFSTPKGGYDPYLPPRRPTRSEIAARRYTAVYEVDMGVHPFSAGLALPSDNDAFEFTAAVDLSWQVLDPARFVASGHRDVPQLVLGELQQAARPVTRRFAIADSAAAERELLQACTVLGPLGAPAGLQVTWTLRLRRDQENIDHQRRLQAIDHSATEQIRAAERGTEVDVEVDRRHRRQDALQIERAMVYGQQQQQLALQQQHWEHEQAMLMSGQQHEQALLMSGQQHELALQQGQQMLELQRIEAQKIEFYQWHLQQGGVQAWALHLAQHPEDSRLVMSSMRDDQLRMIQAQMDLVKQLLNGDTAENYELEGPKQLALRTVSDILNQRLPGVPQSPPLLPPQHEEGPLTGYGNAPGGPGGPGMPGGQPWTSAAPADQNHLPLQGQDRAGQTAPDQPPPGPLDRDQGPAGISQSPFGMSQSPVGTGQSPLVNGGPCAQPPAPAPAPAAPVPGPPAWQPPTAYSPPSPFTGAYPGAPAAPAPTPEAPSWQPPPGYGSTPTLPAQPPASTPPNGNAPQGGRSTPGDQDNFQEENGA